MIKPTCGSKYRFILTNGTRLYAYWQECDIIAGEAVVRLSSLKDGVSSIDPGVNGEFWVTMRNVSCFWRVE